MKRNWKKMILASALTLSLAAAAATAMADRSGGMQGGMSGKFGGAQNSVAVLADSAGEIVTGTVENSAQYLTADTENATVFTMTDEDNQVKITESGTYVISGTCSDGNIQVKKGTTGVVLILEDLDLTSTIGATVSVNKESEVQIVVSGSVTLTDAENPANEESQDAEVADAYDGAALKVKAGATVYLTGDGTLTVNGEAKNGIKVGDTEASLVMAGENLTVNITAANDGINAGYDLSILSGTVNVSAADDAIHADRILTLGSDGAEGPTITISGSSEGLEGTVVNIFSGNVEVTSKDDAINAANKDSLYDSELSYSINITGGSVAVRSGGDGLDSNGNINITGGTTTISSASFGGEAGIDYDGQLYIADTSVINNASGIAGPDQMRGMMGGQGFGTMNGGMMGGMASGQRENGMAGTDASQQDGSMVPSDSMNGFGGRMKGAPGGMTSTEGTDEEMPAQPESDMEDASMPFGGMNSFGGMGGVPGAMQQGGQMMPPDGMNGFGGMGSMPGAMQQGGQMMPPDGMNGFGGMGNGGPVRGGKGFPGQPGWGEQQ